MIQGGISAFRGKRVLLLQGPVGPFFRRLAQDLVQAGAQVFKINFNGGDWLFYPSNALNFQGKPEEWPIYFEALLDALDVEVVMLFGDCRPIHRVAHEIAQRRGLEIGVFEEGYVRPHYVTLERFGTNGHSKLPRNPLFYLNNNIEVAEPPLSVKDPFSNVIIWAGLYYVTSTLLRPLFPYYRHHRPLSCAEVFPWLRAAWRRRYYALKEYGIQDRLTTRWSGRFFLVPLQVHNDTQVHVHSDYDSVAHFIAQVVGSFAAHASRTTVLVIKHHPLDRGYYDYTRYIKELVVKYKLQGRCFYIHDQHLPTLLDHARGVVVINSTVGLSALHHGVPVKVCGDAIYSMQGLTFQGSLSAFWQEAQNFQPSQQLFQRFYNYVIHQTQLNGNFYKRLPIVTSATGIKWKDKGKDAPTCLPAAAAIEQLVTEDLKIGA